MARYSDVTLGEAAELLDTYGVKPTAIEPLAGGAANSSFYVQAGGDYVLVVLDNHDADSAIDLVSIIRYVGEHGIAVDEVIDTASGTETSCTQGGVPVLLKKFVHGIDLSRPSSEDLFAVGATLASIHGIRPPDVLPVGNRHLPVDHWSWIDQGPEATSLRELIVRADDIAAGAAWRSLPMGFCHGDMFGDNLIKRGEDGQIVVLDWETASVDPFVLDLGITCVAFIEGRTAELATTVRTLVAGYESVRTLAKIELETLDDAIIYGLAMLAYHRFVRHNVRFPDPQKREIYRGLVELVPHLDAARGTWRRR